MRYALISATVILVWLLIANPLQAQWVTHHDAVYMPNVSRPAVGVPLIDPRFGTTIRRLTDARALHRPGMFPQYAKRQAWNADDSRLLLLDDDGVTYLYNGTTFTDIRPLDGVGGEDLFWHPTNPSIILYTVDTIIYSYNIETDVLTPEYTFHGGYSWVNTRGEGNLSRDGRYYAVCGQVYDTDVHFRDIVVADIIADTLGVTLHLPDPVSGFDWVSISPLGNFVVVDYATDITGRYEGVEVYDQWMNFIWQKPLGAGHSDLGVDGNGDEVLVMDYYDADSNATFIKKFRLSDGATTVLLRLPWWTDLHISCRNLSRRDWVFISTFDGEGHLTDDSLSWVPFEDEIFALKLDGSGDVQRIAHHHSKRFSPLTPDRDNSVYWSEPHASVSRAGDRILFGSNWRTQIDQDTSVDVYLVDFHAWVTVADTFHARPIDLGLRCLPNPAWGRVTLIGSRELAGADVRIYGIDGTYIGEVRLNERGQGQWNVGGTAAGVYVLRVPGKGERRIVVK